MEGNKVKIWIGRTKSSNENINLFLISVDMHFGSKYTISCDKYRYNLGVI